MSQQTLLTGALEDYMDAEGWRGEGVSDRRAVFASVLFNPGNIRGELGEAIRTYFGCFKSMLGMHVSEGFIESFENERPCSRRGTTVEVAPGQHVMLLRFQAGNALAVILVPMGLPGFSSYLKSCEQSGFSPIVAWQPGGRDRLLLHFPVGKVDVKHLIKLANESADCMDDSLLEHLAALASWCSGNAWPSIVTGAELHETMVSCVVESGAGI
jgi:hypothetical protein